MLVNKIQQVFLFLLTPDDIISLSAGATLSIPTHCFLITFFFEEKCVKCDQILDYSIFYSIAQQIQIKQGLINVAN